MRNFILSVFLIPLSIAAEVTAVDAEAPSTTFAKGIYGELPEACQARSEACEELGLNAVFVSSEKLDAELMEGARANGLRVFAEFNSLHAQDTLATYPDAAPIGPDGQVSEAPEGWRGVCPTHEAYRQSRMAAFEAATRDFDLDGIWLDYHHAEAAWERASPRFVETCFCERCLARFQADTGIELPAGPTAERSAFLLSDHTAQWRQWRQDVLTDWVREYHELLQRTRPQALLGSFVPPWTPDDFDGALTDQLALDLPAQSAWLDVYSPMLYATRLGHEDTPAWTGDQLSAWLSAFDNQSTEVWPIVQVSDWGGEVSVEEVTSRLQQVSENPGVDGVMVFKWGSFRRDAAKVKAVREFFATSKR